MKTALRTASRAVTCSVVSLLLLSVPSGAQTVLQKQAIVLKRVIETQHLHPRPVDDTFSADLFDQFLEDIDPHRLYLTGADLASLEKYRTTLDDELNNKGWAFFPAVAALFQKRVQQADSLVARICSTPFDFTVAESLPAGFDTLRARSDADWKERWRKLLKYQVLGGLERLAVAQLDRGPLNRAAMLAKEPEVRNKVRTRNGQKIKNLLGGPAGPATELAKSYLSGLAACFDPHTGYFDPRDMEGFQTSLNPEGYYFGFTVEDNEDDAAVIAYLMPGSPAWKSGGLNKGDVLVQMQWEGQPPIDLAAAGAEEVNEYMGLSKSERLGLTVRKSGGQVTTVWLRKEKVENDGHNVKSFLLAGRRKIGYIYLPGFYFGWEDSTASSCAADVAREIVKLKKEGIEGIILDVRYNGGGSLKEAIDLAGIFVDAGPMCQIKDRTGKIATLKDANRGTIWDGPLLLMVNSQSASASEVLAGVLQDYNRAIITGSTTYGKATGQFFLPVDTLARNAAKPEYGFVKVTNISLYQVSGKTAQGSGVRPDIELPEAIDPSYPKEAGLPFFLKPEPVKANPYYSALPPIDLSGLRKASAARLAASKRFASLESLVKSQADETEVPVSLKWADAEKELVAGFTAYRQEKATLEKKSAAFEAANHAADKAFFETSVSGKDLNGMWLDRLGTDPYIEENYLILSDLLNNKKN